MDNKVLTIDYDKKGIFLSRPNRYLAEVKIDDKIELVHVHDPGRLTELLYEGNEVLVRHVDKEERKTSWDLIAANSSDGYILIHSSYHRYIAQNFLNNFDISPFGKQKSIKAEVKYKNSRIDFLLEDENNKKTWVEVKGCTLSDGMIAKFPDAPTKRGLKHLNELIELNKSDNAAVLILVLRKADKFVPNKETDPEFTKAFYKAIKKGVSVYPILFEFNNKKIIYKKRLEILDL